jgi:hypothetical protein
MATYANITPARINPTWTPAPYPLGDLARFFRGGSSALAVSRPAPTRPAPAMERV